jgi:hypothetical protein
LADSFSPIKNHLDNGCRLIYGLGGVGPSPGVGEGVELRLTRFTGSFTEQDVVIRVGIERWIEINEVNTLVRKFLGIAQPTEIVAKEKPVHA